MQSAKTIGEPARLGARLVDPKELTLNPDNERDYLADDPDNISLRQSLASEGVLTPLHIHDDGTVDDGNRRLFNIGLLMEAGAWPHGPVPAIVVPRPADAVEAVFARLNKNEARQFSALEQGRAFAKIRAAGLNNAQIAARSPFTAMHVGNMLTLHDAGQEVRDAVRGGEVSPTLAVETARKHGEAAVIDAVALAKKQGKAKATPKHVEAAVAKKTAPVTEIEIEAEAEAEAEIEAEVDVEAEAETNEPLRALLATVPPWEDLPTAPATTREERIEAAARALLDDVRRRHPGEDLKCPLMRALDDALAG